MPDPDTTVVLATSKDIALVVSKIEHLDSSFREWKDTRRADHDLLTQIAANMQEAGRAASSTDRRLERLELSKADRTELSALGLRIEHLATNIDAFGPKLEGVLVTLGSMVNKRATPGNLALTGVSGGGTLGLLLVILFAIAKYAGWL